MKSKPKGGQSSKKTLSSVLGRAALLWFLRLDNFLYKVISFLAVKAEGGLYPKHRLLNYHQFFLDNIKAEDRAYSGQSPDGPTAAKPLCRVLDIGCGSGDLTFDLAKKASKVVGIDLNQKYLEKAKQKNKAENIEYILADATSYTFNEKFDFAVLSNVLEHIENRENFLRKISSIAQKILIRVPLLTRDWLSVYKKEMGVDYKLDKTHFIEYTKKQLIDEIEKAGLAIEKIEINFGEIYAKLQ